MWWTPWRSFGTLGPTHCGSLSQQVCVLVGGWGGGGFRGSPLPSRLSAYPRGSLKGSFLLQAVIPSFLQPPRSPSACPPPSPSLLLLIHQAQLWGRTSTSTWISPIQPLRAPPPLAIRFSCGSGPEPQHGPRDRQPQLHEQALECHKVRGGGGMVHTFGSTTSHTTADLHLQQ